VLVTEGASLAARARLLLSADRNHSAAGPDYLAAPFTVARVVASGARPERVAGEEVPRCPS